MAADLDVPPAPASRTPTGRHRRPGRLPVPRAPGENGRVGRARVGDGRAVLTAQEVIAAVAARAGRALTDDGRRTTVLLCTEGTYPYVGGGVSTWCDILCRQMPHIDFTLFAVTGNPEVELRYDFPPNARSIVYVPLWSMQ